ncbi:receptor-like serine/threonine-protein kinase SD1-8 [Curcuma longa]|uniref:receptor-like serine/threonine-protein kinase SD1-8 n=1 Tax=Curcuma longa TaxID=136217 RepID=UPI003D9F54F9
MSGAINTLFFVNLLMAANLFTLSVAGNTLIPSHPLLDADGASLISPGGMFELGFFSPVCSGNRYLGIWFHNISVQTVVWVANRRRPLRDRSGRLSLTPNGTLLVTNAADDSTILWSSSTSWMVVGNPVAQLLYDGNFVVGDETSSFWRWQSFDFPTDTLLPGMKLGWNLTSRLNRQLTSWASPCDPAPNNFSFGVDLNGDRQVFIWGEGMRSVWRSGPWTGRRYTGAPEMDAEDLFYLDFVETSDEVYGIARLRDPSTRARMVINQTAGQIQSLVWIEGRNEWTVRTFAPRDQCDGVAACGAYGICYPEQVPSCACLHGFYPANPRNWELRAASDGCLRRTELDCATDGFVKQSSVKLPDTSRSTVDRRMQSLDDCRAMCSRNCSCTGYAQANISGSGSGCILWTTELTDIKAYSGEVGQDLYVKLAAADLDAGSSHSSKLYIGVTVAASFAATLVVASIARCIFKMRRKKRLIKEEMKDDLNPPLFYLSTIVDATGNFSDENKLGEGGFGPVYKGILKDGEKEIAVKRLSKTSEQGIDEFENEVKLIAKLQHRSLVQLLGYCIEGDERMLIYEYMPNGSLYSLLFAKNKYGILDWKKRYNIILGIARGLLYLHHDSRFRIIHRDLKASNILLDKDMNPKISDFGMAKVFGGDELAGRTKRVIGTYGYMSPEYVVNGVFSIKSDVYSFGVLILEIITSKRNNGVYNSREHLNLIDHIWSLWKEGKVLDLVDEAIGHSFSMAEVLKCINIGLLCVEERPEDRPTLSSILLMLSNDSAQLPQPKQPAFSFSRDELKTKTDQEDHENNVTITILEPR